MELKKSQDFNKKISDEAHILTQTLKGDVKKQDNLVRTSVKLKDPGIKTQKALPDYLVEDEKKEESPDESSGLFKEG